MSSIANPSAGHSFMKSTGGAGDVISADYIDSSGRRISGDQNGVSRITRDAVERKLTR